MPNGQCKKYKLLSYSKVEDFGRKLMSPCNLITQKYKNEVQNKFKRLINQKELEEKKLKCIEKNNQAYFSYEYTKKTKEQVMQHLATIISDLVQHSVLIQFTTSYLRKQEGLQKYEKKIIKERFIKNNFMAKEEGVSYITYYLIYIPVLKDLEKKETIHIEGWVNFRTKKYKMVLKDMMEQAISDYKAHKAYLECISLLIDTKKYQGEKSEDVLHLIPKDTGSMCILDTKEEEVTKNYIDRYSSELDGEGFYEDDLIMNVFITVAPKKIIIHQKEQFENQHFIETLEHIFKEQVRYCEGCKHCKKIKAD